MSGPSSAQCRPLPSPRALPPPALPCTMSIDPVLKYPANTSSSSSPAFGSGAVRTADEEEAHYQQLELEYSQRWQPPHLYYYTDWIRQKEKYESLRAEYLSVLERWPWWAAKIANVEQQMETVREAIKLVSSHASQSDPASSDPRVWG